MIALLCFVLAVLASPFKSKSRLEAENATLRHQLIVLRRMVHGRIRLTNNDRWLFIQLYRWFPSILRVLTIIRPETIVRWHRAGKLRVRHVSGGGYLRMGRREKSVGSSYRQLAHCIQRYEAEVFAKVIWGAQCGKYARWVLLGETSSRSQARSVRALARKRQITARLRKGLPLQGSSLPSFGFRFSVHTAVLTGTSDLFCHQVRGRLNSTHIHGTH